MSTKSDQAATVAALIRALRSTSASISREAERDKLDRDLACVMYAPSRERAQYAARGLHSRALDILAYAYRLEKAAGHLEAFIREVGES